jgi:hypothetical protein
MVNFNIPPAVSVLNIMYKGQFEERRKEIKKRKEGETEKERKRQGKREGDYYLQHV